MVLKTISEKQILDPKSVTDLCQLSSLQTSSDLCIRHGAVLLKISSLSSFEPFTDHPGRNRREALRVGKARQHQEAELLPPGRSKLGKISPLRALLRKSNDDQEVP